VLSVGQRLCCSKLALARRQAVPTVPTADRNHPGRRECEQGCSRSFYILTPLDWRIRPFQLHSPSTPWMEVRSCKTISIEDLGTLGSRERGLARVGYICRTVMTYCSTAASPRLALPLLRT